MVGSGDWVHLYFYTTSFDYHSGAFYVQYTDPPQYYIEWCTGGWLNFPVDLIPADQTIIWTITKTATTVKIECNEVEVITYSFSDSADSACVTYWSRDTVFLYFNYGVSNEFRAKPGTSFQCNFHRYVALVFVFSVRFKWLECMLLMDNIQFDGLTFRNMHGTAGHSSFRNSSSLPRQLWRQGDGEVFWRSRAGWGWRHHVQLGHSLHLQHYTILPIELVWNWKHGMLKNLIR